MKNVNELIKAIVIAAAIGVFFATLPGCQKQEGPAERAGKDVDRAVEKVGDQIEKAGGKLQDAAKGDNK